MEPGPQGERGQDEGAPLPRSGSPDPHAERRAAEAPSSAVLALELKRGLPCVRCRYDLAGLSILSPCPECGTPVKATLLCIVDPHAREFQPLRRPGIVAGGLVLWAGMGLLAAAACWWPRVADAVAYTRDAAAPSPTPAGALAALAVLASGAGGLVLLNPHPRLPARHRWSAAAALCCYPLLAAALYWLLAVVDAPGDMPHLHPAATGPGRTLLRLLIGALLAAIILGLRPVARCLYTRSLLFRHGRADRQTLAAVVWAVALGAVGDAAHLASGALPPHLGEPARVVGAAAIAIASLFITIGLAGVLVDVIRLAPVLMDPPVTMGSLVQARFIASDAPGDTPTPPGPLSPVAPAIPRPPGRAP